MVRATGHIDLPLGTWENLATSWSFDATTLAPISSQELIAPVTIQGAESSTSSRPKITGYNGGIAVVYQNWTRGDWVGPTQVRYHRLATVNSAPVRAAPAPSFTFTMKPPVVSTQDRTLTLKGINLGDVTSIKVAGSEVKIVQKSAGEIVLDVPEGPEGYRDVEVFYSSGKMTLQGWLSVVKPYLDKRTQSITQFKGNVPTAASLAALKKLYLQGTTANIVNCVATVASNAPASAVSKATAQAKATCQAALNFSVRLMAVNVSVSKTGKLGSKPVVAVTFDRTLSDR